VTASPGRREPPTPKSRVAAIEGWYTLDEAAPVLLGTRGVDSGSYFWPPSLAVSANPHAPFETREPVELSRNGTLWSWTTNHYAPPEPAVQAAPYTICAVELAREEMVVLGPLATGADEALLRVGMEMELVLGPLYDDDEHEYVIYQWSPLRLAGGSPRAEDRP
jgi:uncharacterized OB-fold protein